MTPDNAANFAIDYLEAMERRDLTAARTFVGDTVELIFPGGRRFTSIDQIVRNSGSRYRRIAKQIERRDVWQTGEAICVLISGTLHGEWHDGRSFDAVRFADRFEILNGRIVRQEVWNDTGEALLAAWQEAKP